MPQSRKDIYLDDIGIVKLNVDIPFARNPVFSAKTFVYLEYHNIQLYEFFMLSKRFGVMLK